MPLSPAAFVKIRDGFIAFLKQPAGTPIELIIPQGFSMRWRLPRDAGILVDVHPVVPPGLTSRNIGLAGSLRMNNLLKAHS